MKMSTPRFTPRLFFILQKYNKMASLQKIQKSHLHIAVSIPLSSKDFIIQKNKKGGGGGGWWLKSNLFIKYTTII